MNSEKYSIDLSKVEEEILAIDEKIASLNRDKEIKIAVKNYILEYGIFTKDSSKNNFSTQGSFSTHTTINPIVENDGELKIGVSEFILNYLKEQQQAGTSNIINAYSKAKKKGYEVVRNNVSNALSRLKESNKIIVVEKNAFGSVFALKENEAKIA